VIIEGEGVVDSLASKFITSPALISDTPVKDEFASDVISAVGVVDERPVHPEIETNNIIQHTEKVAILIGVIGHLCVISHS
jgi:hypothetical protein